MPRSGSTRALIGAAIVLVLAACGSGAGAVNSPTASVAAPTAAVPAKPAPSAEAPASAAASAGPQVYDGTKLGHTFDLPMSITLPAGWILLTAPNYAAPRTFGFVRGSWGDNSQWWGGGFNLIDDGSVVLDPRFLDQPSVGPEAELPWPASYIDYVTSLPGASVVSPAAAASVGGVPGRRVVVTTPAMHPTVRLKDDTAWLGGGKSGIDPAFTREFIEFTVNGRHLLFEYDDLPQYFDGHVAQVDAIVDTVTFP
jgi:hypothetical protein